MEDKGLDRLARIVLYQSRLKPWMPGCTVDHDHTYCGGIESYERVPSKIANQAILKMINEA